MTPTAYHHVVNGDGQQSLTVFTDEGSPITVTGDHPSFEDILSGAKDGTDHDELRDLADASQAVAAHIEPLSERVSVAAGRVYFDGDELDTSLADHILRLIEAADANGWQSLVGFLEKLYTNPSEHARTQLYDWLRSKPFGITYDGDLIGYKGVDAGEEHADAQFYSCFNGPAIVNGDPYSPEEAQGVPQSIGDIVELPRSTVDPDAYVECSHGLHVGTFDFASSYGDTILKLIVNPRDVVGVPTGVHGSEKIRVCRYVIEDTIEEPHSEPVVALG